MDALAAHLNRHSFRELFTEILGWDLASGSVGVMSDGREFQFDRVAHKRGVQILRCETDRLTIVNRGLLRNVQKRVSRIVHEHVLIYTSENPPRQVWQWAVRLPDGRRLRHREHPFFSQAPPSRLLNRLAGLRFTLDQEESVTLVDALDRVRRALDTTADLNLFVRKPKYAARSDELAAAMRNGSTAALHDFVLFHQPLVRWMAPRLSRRLGIDLEDAEQIGMLGLLHAAERYDPDRGFQFSTYATYCIEGLSKRHGPPLQQLIRIPMHIHWPCVEARRNALQVASSGPEAVRAYFRRLEECEPAFAKQLHHFERATNWKSLSDRTKPEYLEARSLRDPAEGPLDAAMRAETVDGVRMVLERLHTRDAQVLRLRYGIEGPSCTLEQIGRILSLTRERVRQIQDRAEERLRHLIGLEMPSLIEAGDNHVPEAGDSESPSGTPENIHEEAVTS